MNIKSLKSLREKYKITRSCASAIIHLGEFPGKYAIIENDGNVYNFSTVKQLIRCLEDYFTSKHYEKKVIIVIDNIPHSFHRNTIFTRLLPK